MSNKPIPQQVLQWGLGDAWHVQVSPRRRDDGGHMRYKRRQLRGDPKLQESELVKRVSDVATPRPRHARCAPMYIYTCTAVLGLTCTLPGPIISFQRISWSRILFTHARFAPSLNRLFTPPRAPSPPPLPYTSTPVSSKKSASIPPEQRHTVSPRMRASDVLG